MPFSFDDTWTACEGSTTCPCPNHLPPTLRLESVFRDPIDDDPSLYRLAFGNDCPTPTQENILASSLSDTKSNIENVDRSLEKITQLRHALLAEVVTVERELQLLRDHRDQLSRAVKRREQILAPIRRMPSEILAHILRFTLRKPVRRTPRRPGGLLSSSEMPNLASQWELDAIEDHLGEYQRVCHWWRRDILNSPGLWSQLLVVPWPDYFEDPDSLYARYLTQHISRAGQTTLDVYITLAGHGPFEEMAPLPLQVLTMLHSIAPRIQKLHIALPSRMIRDLHPLRDALMSLKILKIHNITPQISDDNSMSLFANLPNLIDYKTVDITDPLGWYQIPWLQLKRYSVICGPSTPDFESQTALSVLQRAIHLERVVLDLSSGSLSLPVENGPIVCAHLTTLKLKLNHRSGENPIPQIFTHCTFPKLTELCVEFPTYTGDFHSLMVCLQRSRSPLSALEYHGGDIVSTDMVELLKTIPTVTTLFMEDYVSGIDDAVLHCLCVPQDRDAVVRVPGFRSLYIDGDIQLDPSLFMDMVKSRWNVAPLRSIDLHWSDMTEETRAKAQGAVRGLKPYEMLGLKLKLTDQYEQIQ
ncbi:hypothetical protein BDZ89DRAFT_1162583 [Hymenopellis radicata]|nr:hypothetical protein BDZ89DRAFT_1162583 [Hymenopellis radicata]